MIFRQKYKKKTETRLFKQILNLIFKNLMKTNIERTFYTDIITNKFKLVNKINKELINLS